MANRTVTAPHGFLAAGVACGIKVSGKPDLAMLMCERPAAAAAIFTTNVMKAAPVRRSLRLMPRGHGRLETVVVNSGNANACTGRRGDRDAQKMAELAAVATDAKAEGVLVSSTGIIGRPLPMDAIEAGIAAAAGRLNASAEAGHAFATAIMTTDTRAKEAFAEVKIGGATVRVAGCAKGAGMIAPNMATMLAYITTDADIAPSLLHAAIVDAAADTFNAITVDGHNSTNDTLAVLASGLAGNRPIRKRDTGYRKLAAAIADASRQLAEAIVRDGEGATKLVRVTVSGAATVADAERAARAIADSPLAKCALHGSDPNWGRFTSAAGYSGAKCDAGHMKCSIGPVTIFRNGQPVAHDAKKVARLMAADDISIAVDLGAGRASKTILTCDLSREYITINADYHT
ncbi:MAG: Arginine biosynthesis bifunctional protein ArgJ [Phycisphaerae bacterium]|nr:Arginine biosynthesis bifunctional protein ArgJ [Phycisphaerae bacterium]